MRRSPTLHLSKLKSKRGFLYFSLLMHKKEKMAPPPGSIRRLPDDFGPEILLFCISDIEGD